MSVMLIAKNSSAFAACAKSTVIGCTIATSPKNSNNSMMSEPVKSPRPTCGCFLPSAFNSMAMSGSVVPIPIIIKATKYSGTAKYRPICIELNTSHLPLNKSATKQPKKMTASRQIVFKGTFFLMRPNVPSILHKFSKYAQNAISNIAPSGLLSSPSSAKINGSMSATHMGTLSFVKMVGSREILRPSTATSPSANAACIMFEPRIAPYPTPAEPDMNPESDEMISGADAAIATTTMPMMASDSPNFFA